MCGIAGFNLSPAEKADSLTLARALIVSIESRGRDASGAAWAETDGVYFDKAAQPSSRYAPRMPLHPLTTNCILHTRFATSGDPADNNNNHPFALPGIVGVHNGVLHGERAVFDMLGVKPTTKTDSEAIFALLAYSGLRVTEALTLFDGDAAIAWLDTDAPEVLHLARTEGRPLWIADTEHGSTVFASTEFALRGACSRARVNIVATYEVPEWTYLTVRNGTMTHFERFVPTGWRPRQKTTRYYHGPTVRQSEATERWASTPTNKPRKPNASKSKKVTKTTTTETFEGKDGKKFSLVTATKREPVRSSGYRPPKQVPMWDIDPATGRAFEVKS